MSVETTCYVSLAYFADDHPYSDYVVHEAAHIFHNARRRTAGLQETRRQQRLLPIDYEKRELFAFACEAYSRLLELAQRPAERRRELGHLSQGPLPPRDQVNVGEYLDILAEAAGRRNGWKAILERCKRGKSNSTTSPG
jgi:hypothetical protein